MALKNSAREERIKMVTSIAENAQKLKGRLENTKVTDRFLDIYAPADELKAMEARIAHLLWSLEDLEKHDECCKEDNAKRGV